MWRFLVMSRKQHYCSRVASACWSLACRPPTPPSPRSTVDKSYSPARYATNRTAKIPSMVPMAVIATVRFTGPKKIS